MRLEEITKRLAAIKDDIERLGDELTAEAVAAYETEVTSLTEERRKILESAEKRTMLLNGIASGTPAGLPEGVKPTVTRTFAETQRNAEPADRYDTMEYRKAFMNYAMRGADIPIEYRADAITKTTDVGSVIPTTVLNQIIEKLESTGMILPLVTRTSYRGGLEIPTSSVKPEASWVAEGKGSDKQKKTTGKISFTYHKLRCAVAVTLEVDTMALEVFEATLINNVVEAMIKAIEQSIVDGTGFGQPKGIITETAPTGQALSVVAPSYQDLLDAESALPLAYESGAVWCMTKKTFMSYFGLLDDNGQPIGRVNYGIAGRPERSLLGRTVVLCDYLPSYDASLAANKKFAFLFNFKDYVLNTNYAMGIKRYEDNETDDLVTKAIMLVDGKVVDTGSLVTLAKKTA